MKKYTGFRPVNQLIEAATQPSCQKFGFVNQRIIANWQHIVGKQLAKFTTPGRISFGPEKTNGGTLYIEVTNPGFSLELQAQESRIVDKISTYFGYQAISRVKVVIAQERPKAKPEPKKKLKKTKISSDDFSDIESNLDDIQDEELKKTLKSLASELFEKK